MDALTVRVVQLHAEVFENLQALGAVLHILLEARGDALTKAGLIKIAIIHV